jgi:chemotaxis protein CheX
MNMELIQPFINSLDAVISETMHCSARVTDVSMEVGSYQRNGVAALVFLSGDIEGRIILDMDADAASQAASDLSEIAGDATEETAREIVCELTNMVIGNSVTQLNDRGFKFKVHPPQLFLIDVGPQGTLTSETVVLRFQLPKGAVYLNIAVHEHSEALVGSQAQV